MTKVETSSEFEREKWLAEHALRGQEVSLRSQEIDLKRIELNRSRWINPLVIAIFAATVAALGNAGVTLISSYRQSELERERAVLNQNLEQTKSEAARILEVVKTNDPDRAAANLKFLVEIGLIADPSVIERMRTYLAERKPGQGIALPAPQATVGPLPMKSYTTSYISFQVPATWECKSEEDAYVCSDKGVLAFSAVIIAKVADPQRDNPAAFASAIGQRREWKNQSGKIIVSELKASGKRCIEGQAWYWGKQLGSELENFYTEYFAGLKNNISALVTISYHKSLEPAGISVSRAIGDSLRWTSKPLDADKPDCISEK